MIMMRCCWALSNGAGPGKETQIGQKNLSSVPEYNNYSDLKKVCTRGTSQEAEEGES